VIFSIAETEQMVCKHNEKLLPSECSCPVWMDTGRQRIKQE